MDFSIFQSQEQSISFLSQEFFDLTQKNQDIHLTLEKNVKSIVKQLTTQKATTSNFKLGNELSEQSNILRNLVIKMHHCQNQIIRILERVNLDGIFGEIHERKFSISIFEDDFDYDVEEYGRKPLKIEGTSPRSDQVPHGGILPSGKVLASTGASKGSAISNLNNIEQLERGKGVTGHGGNITGHGGSAELFSAKLTTDDHIQDHSLLVWALAKSASALSELFTACYEDNKKLLRHCWQFQAGTKLKNWHSGDKAASLGHLSLMHMKPLINQPLHFTEQAVHLALEAKHVPTAVWLCDIGLCKNTMLDYAVESGCDEVVFQVLELDVMGTEVALAKAAAKGRLELLQHLLANKKQFIRFSGRECISMDETVGNGHVEVAAYLWSSSETEVKCPSSDAITQAAAGGHLDMLEWVHEVAQIMRGSGSSKLWTSIADSEAMNAAAAHGHLEILKYLHTNSHCLRCTPQAMDDAAAGGHLYVVEWLHFNRTEGCSGHAIDSAAENGHLDVVEFLHFNRTEGCSNYAFDWAAKYGHLHVLKFLHNNRTEGCTERAMDWAARGGHLEVVKWLHNNRVEGCTKTILDGPASQGHLEVCEWLDKNREEAAVTQWTLDRAAEYGHLDVVKWLHRIKTVICSEHAMDRAAASGHLEVVEWLHFNRTEGCSTKAIDGASANGHCDVVEWLLHHRKEGFTSRAFRKAAARGHFHVVRVLEEFATVNQLPKTYASSITI